MKICTSVVLEGLYCLISKLEVPYFVLSKQGHFFLFTEVGHKEKRGDVPLQLPLFCS